MMGNAPEQIISDDDIIHVHGYANFGSMTPREVVNDGVRKYAVGFTGGATQLAILREHGLVTKPKGAGYKSDLTEKGKLYARSIWNTHFCRADLSPAPSWQPIATAPKDGKRIIAYTHDDQIKEAWWRCDFIDGTEYWQDDYDGELQPTHWMPFPAPPEAS